VIEPQRATHSQSLSPRAGSKVMIVEDDPDIAALVADVLSEEGY
jgi:hypothetical protein